MLGDPQDVDSFNKLPPISCFCLDTASLRDVNRLTQKQVDTLSGRILLSAQRRVPRVVSPHQMIMIILMKDFGEYHSSSAILPSRGLPPGPRRHLGVRSGRTSPTTWRWCRSRSPPCVIGERTCSSSKLINGGSSPEDRRR